MTVPELHSHWCMEIPQHRSKDSAQVHQTLFSFGGVVWVQRLVHILLIPRINNECPLYGLHMQVFPSVLVGREMRKTSWCPKSLTSVPQWTPLGTFISRHGYCRGDTGQTRIFAHIVIIILVPILGITYSTMSLLD